LARAPGRAEIVRPNIQTAAVVLSFVIAGLDPAIHAARPHPLILLVNHRVSRRLAVRAARSRAGSAR
jgi:hypothetical protein